jgi:hypothetical protein
MKKIIKIVLFIFVGLPIAAFILLLVIGTIAKLAGVKTTSPERVITSTPAPTVIPTAEVAQVKTIKYEMLQQWDINNGGLGKIILIPTDYLNEDDMVVLGKKLNEDTKNDKHAFIMVFTDKKAAELRDKLIDDSMTKDEEKFYDTHYVGQFTKNGNSGLHAFVIYFDGVSGTNSKTIKY